MSTKHVILGVLMQCPGHGYQIKKIFAPFISRDGLNDGQVYPILTRLEKDGLVSKEVVQQEKTPNKHIYHITDAGREEFINWLSGPTDESDPVKYDFFMQYSFLMKCNFFEHLSRDERIQKLEAQIAAAKDKIAEYKHVREDMSEKGLSNYKLKIVDFGIETQLLKIRWVEGLLEDELADRSARTRKQKKSAPKPPKAKSSP
jgi:DNA-binding PadR family transcriptional regulator